MEFEKLKDLFTIREYEPIHKKVTFENGDVYDGEWYDGRIDGKGDFFELKTGNIYSGS